MDKIIPVISAATGGWMYQLDITASQAEDILNAVTGERIELNRPGEVLVVHDAKTICHFLPIPGGMTSEELVRSGLLRKLQELLGERAWSTNDDDE